MSFDAANCVNDVLYRLGFQSLADLQANSPWLTAAELYQWADEALKRLSYKSGVFLTYDTSITATPGTATYNLQTNHVFTLAAWLGTQPLRITPVRDLWALDGAWSTTIGPAKRASLDAGSVGTITLYPNPTQPGTLAQVCQEMAAQIQQGASQVALPSVLQDWATYAMLAGARGKESEAAMPEMAAHFQKRCELYESVIEHLFGPGQ